VAERCWLIDGSEPGQWQTCVQVLRGAGWLEELPWALWLPESRARAANESNAWEQGAVEVFDAGQGTALAHCIESLLQRLRSQHGQAAQLRLRLAEQQAWRASLDNIPTPIFIKNVAGVYTEVNQAFVDFLGLPRAQIIGRTVHDVAPPELAQIYEEADRSLLATGTRQIYDTRVRWVDGSLRDVTFYKAVFHHANGVPMGRAGAIFDITEKKRMEISLRTLAETDVLTGLLNRRSFIDQAERRLRDARTAQEPVTVMLFDLDGFKQINDQHGHAVGDAVLRHISQLIHQQLRVDDLLARIGGDEFAIMLGGDQDGQVVAQRLPRVAASSPLGEEFGGCVAPSAWAQRSFTLPSTVWTTCSIWRTGRCTRPNTRAATSACCTTTDEHATDPSAAGLISSTSWRHWAWPMQENRATSSAVNFIDIPPIKRALT
jgi:PAS domain S-box-containing protein